MLRVSLIAIFALVGGPAVALSLSFNAGPVVFKDDLPDTPPEIAAFALGEDVIVTIDVDETVPDLDATVGRGLFEDEFADWTITGASTGATIVMTDIGAFIEIDAADEIDFNTLFLVSDSDPFGLSDAPGSDIDYSFGTNVFSDPDTLGTSLLEFDALLNADGVLRIPNLAATSTALLDFYLSPPFPGLPEVFPGLEFGPAASVPLPPALPALALGVIALGLASRRRG